MIKNEQEQTGDDEIDLKELFLSLWAYKLLIMVISVFCVVSAGYYAINADKVYIAESTFALDDNDGSSGLLGSLGSDLGALGALAGISGADVSGAGALLERVVSREFILEVSDELDLLNDELFNPYNPDFKEPVWRARLKLLLGMQSKKQDPERIQLWNVIKEYQELVTVDETDAGTISVSVRHKVPERAAEIANHIVKKIISMTSQESIEDVDEKLSYLSRTLADASQELKDAQDALKEYSLENSTQAMESFTVGSVMLDDLRTQRQRSADRLEAILALKAALSEGEPTFQDYELLRKKFPQLDEASFRRIMGLSEVNSAWSWPSFRLVEQVELSVRDRFSSLDGEIRELEEDVVRYAISAEELATLKRNLMIAEATYEVLIQQVKSQSLIAGFKPDNSKVYAVADVPINPSEPKRNLILAVGLVLGIFLGSALALALSTRRNVYFSKSSLLNALNASHSHQVKALSRLKGKDLAGVQKQTEKKPLHWARQTVLELDILSGGEPVFLCDVSGEKKADVLGRTIAATAGNLGRDVALVDLSRPANQADTELPATVGNELASISKANSCSEYVYLSGKQNLDLMYSKSLRRILDALSKKHDLVLFTCNLDGLGTVMSSSIIDQPTFVVRVRPGRTSTQSIKSFLNRGKVGVVLHD